MTDHTQVTPELIESVRGVIADSVRHTYSVSRVYAAYNAAMGKNEKPQTCGSCLQRRVRELKAWLADYERNSVAKLRPTPPVEYYELKDGGRVTITDGKVKNEEGKGLVAGKYPTTDGGTVVVAVGSKGRYEAKQDPQDNAPGGSDEVPPVGGLEDASRANGGTDRVTTDELV